MSNHDLVTNDSAVPTRKVTASALGGASAAIFAWLIGEFAGVQMPPGIEGAVAVIAGFILAYFVRDSANT